MPELIEVIPAKGFDEKIVELNVPGSKYLANRLLIITALAKGSSVLRNVPANDDIITAMKSLRKLGVDIVDIKEESEHNSLALTIRNAASKKLHPSCSTHLFNSARINVRDSGTLLRFMTGLASLAKGKTTITGSARIKERPIGELLKALRALGVSCESNNGFPPVAVKGGTFRGGTAKIRGSTSSQFISSLLLIAPYAENDVQIIVKNLVSKYYVDMTVRTMKSFRVNVERQGYESFRIRAGQAYSAREYTLPGDWSSANYFLGAAAILGIRVRIRGLDMSEKGEAQFADLLVRMGCKVRKGKDWIELAGAELSGIEADMPDMPDSVQTLAAVALFARGTTRIKNIAHLKHKESNRILDTASELKKLGAEVKTTNNELVIRSRALKPATLNPHNDHRLAMSLALVGLRIPKVKILHPNCVSKSFPLFWKKLEEIGSGIIKK